VGEAKSTENVNVYSALVKNDVVLWLSFFNSSRNNPQRKTSLTVVTTFVVTLIVIKKG